MPDFSASRLLSPFFGLLILLAALIAATPQSSAEEAIAPSKPKTRQTPSNGAITDTTIKTEMTKQRVTNLKIQAERPGAAIRIHPQTIDITVLGPLSDPGEANDLKKNIFAYIDLSQSAPGVYARPARIILPEGYVLIDATPEIFVVEIRLTKNTTN